MNRCYLMAIVGTFVVSSSMSCRYSLIEAMVVLSPENDDGDDDDSDNDDGGGDGESNER